MSGPDLVAVEATEERFRVLTHAASGEGFDADGKGMWPADQTTYRMRNEGALRIIDPVVPKPGENSSDAGDAPIKGD